MTDIGGGDALRIELIPLAVAIASRVAARFWFSIWGHLNRSQVDPRAFWRVGGPAILDILGVAR